jgi:hypothetical protein
MARTTAEICCAMWVNDFALLPSYAFRTQSRHRARFSHLSQGTLRRPPTYGLTNRHRLDFNLSNAHL